MELTSSRAVPASVETTWAALNDPETLKGCIPGCESIERVSDTELKVAMTARVGPVSAKFSGRIILSDVVAPTSYKMSFEGQGGAAGFARGEAKVADDFFACFVERLGGGAGAAAGPVVAPTEAAATSRTLWLRLAVAIAIIAAVFIYWLTRPA